MSPARNRSRSASKVVASQIRRSVPPALAAPNTSSRQAARGKLAGKLSRQVTPIQIVRPPRRFAPGFRRPVAASSFATNPVKAGDRPRQPVLRSFVLCRSPIWRSCGESTTCISTTRLRTAGCCATCCAARASRRGPHTSKPADGHNALPYLLRGVRSSGPITSGR
jgi:hypothetical protein